MLSPPSHPFGGYSAGGGGGGGTKKKVKPSRGIDAVNLGASYVIPVGAAAAPAAFTMPSTEGGKQAPHRSPPPAATWEGVVDAGTPLQICNADVAGENLIDDRAFRNEIIADAYGGILFIAQVDLPSPTKRKHTLLKLALPSSCEPAVVITQVTALGDGGLYELKENPHCMFVNGCETGTFGFEEDGDIGVTYSFPSPVKSVMWSATLPRRSSSSSSQEKSMSSGDAISVLHLQWGPSTTTTTTNAAEKNEQDGGTGGGATVPNHLFGRPAAAANVPICSMWVRVQVIFRHTINHPFIQTLAALHEASTEVWKLNDSNSSNNSKDKSSMENNSEDHHRLSDETIRSIFTSCKLFEGHEGSSSCPHEGALKILLARVATTLPSEVQAEILSFVMPIIKTSDRQLSRGCILKSGRLPLTHPLIPVSSMTHLKDWSEQLLTTPMRLACSFGVRVPAKTSAIMYPFRLHSSAGTSHNDDSALVGEVVFAVVKERRNGPLPSATATAQQQGAGGDNNRSFSAAPTNVIFDVPCGSHLRFTDSFSDHMQPSEVDEIITDACELHRDLWQRPQPSSTERRREILRRTMMAEDDDDGSGCGVVGFDLAPQSAIGPMTLPFSPQVLKDIAYVVVTVPSSSDRDSDFPTHLTINETNIVMPSTSGASDVNSSVPLLVPYPRAKRLRPTSSEGLTIHGANVRARFILGSALRRLCNGAVFLPTVSQLRTQSRWMSVLLGVPLPSSFKIQASLLLTKSAKKVSIPLQPIEIGIGDELSLELLLGADGHHALAREVAALPSDDARQTWREALEKEIAGVVVKVTDFSLPAHMCRGSGSSKRNLASMFAATTQPLLTISGLPKLQTIMGTVTMVPFAGFDDKMRKASTRRLYGTVDIHCGAKTGTQLVSWPNSADLVRVSGNSFSEFKSHQESKEAEETLQQQQQHKYYEDDLSADDLPFGMRYPKGGTEIQRSFCEPADRVLGTKGVGELGDDQSNGSLPLGTIFENDCGDTAAAISAKKRRQAQPTQSRRCTLFTEVEPPFSVWPRVSPMTAASPVERGRQAGIIRGDIGGFAPAQRVQHGFFGDVGTTVDPSSVNQAMPREGQRLREFEELVFGNSKSKKRNGNGGAEDEECEAAVPRASPANDDGSTLDDVEPLVIPSLSMMLLTPSGMAEHVTATMQQFVGS